MRINSSDAIAGVSVVRLRDFFKRWDTERFDTVHTAGAFADFFRLPSASASRLARALLELGYINAAKERDRRQFYALTLAGSRFAHATTARPLRKATVGRQLQALIERAHAINSDAHFVYRIVRIELFGSALKGVDRPNDIDLAVTLRARHRDRHAHEDARDECIDQARRGGRRFRTLEQKYSWPHEEVLRALRGRARGVSLFPEGSPQRLGSDSRVIFDADEEVSREAPRDI